MSALRCQGVSFLNARPLVAALKSEPPRDEHGALLFDVEDALPSACAAALAEDRCDLALVPVATLLDHPEWEVVPDVAIACRGAVQTVLVVAERPLEELTRIHLDAASRSSALLLRVLLRARGLEPQLVVAPHGEGPSLVHDRDGALVIGDAAFGLADRFPHVVDLGQAWFEETGLPMVFAVWAARPGLLQPVHVEALQRAKTWGTEHAEALARQYAAEHPDGLPEARYADYLRRAIRYGLDAYEREGLVEYLTRARALLQQDVDDVAHVNFACVGYAPLRVAARPRAPLSVSATLAKARAGERIDLREGLLLYDEADLLALGEVADQRRAALHPEGVVTYIVDRNVNYTNVCTARCKFCNFYVPPSGKDHDERAYVLSKEVLAEKFRETEQLGGVQILLQGGLNPELGLAWYEDLFRWTKANFRLRLHALSPTEVIHLAHLEDISVRDVLVRLREAGMDSLPGGGAELLHDEIRNRISPFKNTTDEWLAVMREAHMLGMKTTCTMVFGFQETGDHILTHLDRLRALQDEALARDNGGQFTAFITWPFQAEGTRLKLRDDTSAWRYLRIQALARLYLDNIPNLQVSWPTLGPEIGEVGLRFGANDFGSVMIEENVVSQAGAHFMLTAEQIEHHIRQAGFRPARRNMQYELLGEPALA
ncbi:MAG TPA: CofH family radical SAM protein [Nannocystaceae bacterium]|nr:CofH family radical SAM protein [Nannocystaceae bacterium]